MAAILMAVVCVGVSHAQGATAEENCKKAEAYLNTGNDEAAFLYYKKAAEQGHQLAQFYVGNCYANG